ncbi:hypothetical protein [Nocardioides antri]|uniref:Sulfotransferase family protein n=1 Tax=Nocardioides antri TaxID=2607659 RepID=A0A5B1M0N6_9ACTN|nr:hypothetical protein [Nocardioides antri]KAA1426301.1 hypothetical protein F0U47_15495 [Nocardioides antri]
MSASAPPEVVLHIGSDKTGTTSLQQLLRRNRRELAGRGILYPRAPGPVRHAGLGLYARPDHALLESRDWLRGGYPAPDVFRRRLRRRLVREVATWAPARVVLSDESLARMAPDSITRLRGLIDALGGPVRVVVYLRRQDDHLVSRYQQAVKVGEVLPLAAWALRDFSSMYDFAALLRNWQGALGPREIVVRPFERARFSQGSLEQDFLDATGMDVRLADLRPVELRNESLGVEAVEMLRILNLHRRENQGLPTWQISNRDHVKRLRGTESGPQVTLPEPDLDRFMQQWEESNRRVAVEHLGDPSGELFHAPRRTEGTTTDQVLDPARLDHYLALMEIPEQQHGAIRRIAEREAARGQTDGSP